MLSRIYSSKTSVCLFLWQEFANSFLNLSIRSLQPDNIFFSRKSLRSVKWMSDIINIRVSCGFRIKHHNIDLVHLRVFWRYIHSVLLINRSITKILHGLRLLKSYLYLLMFSKLIYTAVFISLNNPVSRIVYSYLSLPLKFVIVLVC